MTMVDVEEVQLEDSSTEFEYEDVVRIVDEALNEMGADGDTYMHKGENIGWRNISGEEIETFAGGEELLQQMMPDSPWSMTISFCGDAIEIDLSHHDSPTGETHIITQANGKVTQ